MYVPLLTVYRVHKNIAVDIDRIAMREYTVLVLQSDIKYFIRVMPQTTHTCMTDHNTTTTQTDRQPDKQTDRQPDKQTDRQTEKGFMLDSAIQGAVY